MAKLHWVREMAASHPEWGSADTRPSNKQIDRHRRRVWLSDCPLPEATLQQCQPLSTAEATRLLTGPVRSNFFAVLCATRATTDDAVYRKARLETPVVNLLASRRANLQERTTLTVSAAAPCEPRSLVGLSAVSRSRFAVSRELSLLGPGPRQPQAPLLGGGHSREHGAR